MINKNVVQIVEVLERAIQGVTQPFLCRGADGAFYYVKGRSAGRKSLVAEWLASSMAYEFGLPVAPFCIAEVDQQLVDYGPAEVGDLGSGYVFASRRIENVMELSWSNLKDVRLELQRDIVMFDYWVKNQDRSLTELGGNPNLLWEPAQKALRVIDHNQAFDLEFSCDDFFRTHVFAQAWNDIYQDFVERPRYEQRIATALERFDEAWDRIPDSWLWLGEGVPLAFTPDDARSILMEYNTLPDFWSSR